MNKFPIWLTFELTNVCNLNCEMCKVKQFDKLPPGFAELKVYRQFILNLADSRLEIENFKLFWLGEPLLHPDFIKFLEATHNVPMIAFDTNGMGLTKEVALALVEKGKCMPVHVKFSLDANTSGTYEKIRVGGDLAKVRQNIERLLSLRQGAKYPVVMIQFIVQPGNVKEMKDFKSYWEAIFKQHGLSFLVCQEQNWATQDGICFNHCDAQGGTAAQQRQLETFFAKAMEAMK